jgi:hypothetical protein
MPRIISLDITSEVSGDVDISEFFPYAEVHAITNTFHRVVMDSIEAFRPFINLSIHPRVSMDRYRTVETMDVGIHAIMDVRRFSLRYREYPSRPHTLDLVPPFDHIPHGALDLRFDRVIAKRKLYSDLFRRRLPRSLALRRSYQQTGNYLRTRRRPILVGVASFFVVSIPLVFYIKYTVEHGYNALMNLRFATDIADIQRDAMTAKGDFDRAGFLFLPFSWIP